ncbi:hypothetical protein [Cellulosilyticum ruminicola]|uniref:hypothetical protein n=1 Tax=Cellulosilyticum ruminicola TaxID=425254 RepID=UPI0006CFE693|nr:hypothetical protein [Cellulosilyticum ruminicola]
MKRWKLRFLIMCMLIALESWNVEVTVGEERKICYKCHGEGHEICSVCTGVGLQLYSIVGNKSFLGLDTIICTRCNGSGKISCTVCGGVGTLKK